MPRLGSVSLSSSSSLDSNTQSLQDCRIAVVGAGPSGLLLAHELLLHGASHVSLYEQRTLPVAKNDESSTTASSITDSGGGRAYALGLGTRGRTALQSIPGLWDAVTKVGLLSERFDLHINKLRICLRKESNAKDKDSLIQPSLLLFQSDLCKVLFRELQNRYQEDRLNVSFGTSVVNVQVDDMRLVTAPTSSKTKTTVTEPFDLIVGCDGVNSVVRQHMPKLKTREEILPGEFKVARVSQMPPQLHPSAVALLIPSGQKTESEKESEESGQSLSATSTTAFVEPTRNGTACVLFTSRNATADRLLSSQNETELADLIVTRFPKLQGIEHEAAKSLAATTRTSTASSVECETFHSDRIVLVGDAAHSTGGVSGQGVNSALQDSVVLSNALCQELYNCQDARDPIKRKDAIRQALLHYSQQQVPEARALYDLSFGPNSKSFRKKFKNAVKLALDTIFKGKFGIGDSPLQTKLTTSLTPFSEIRRERDALYDEPFPPAEYWDDSILQLHQQMLPKDL